MHRLSTAGHSSTCDVGQADAGNLEIKSILLVKTIQAVRAQRPGVAGACGARSLSASSLLVGNVF